MNTFQAAAAAIGQPNLTSNAIATSASGMSVVYGNATANGNVLYVPDYGNNRVLGFNTIPTGSGAAANFVLGQPSFTTAAFGTSASAMSGPQTVQAYQGKLLVLEYTNRRILVFNTAPTSTGAPADVAVGEPNLTTGAGACSPAGLINPESFRVVNGKLIVGDSGNNRVLIWNSIPTVSGAPADLVLGQGDFTHCASNDDAQLGVAGASPTARTFNYPTDVWSDGTRLLVMDSSNNRVLIWNPFPTAKFMPANVVLGQGDFTHAAPNDDNQDGVSAAPTARTLNFPYFMESDGIGLIVTDANNNRVLLWNTIPGANFAPADKVLGQSDFVHNAVNDDNQDGITDPSGPTGRVMTPYGVRLIGNRLFVADYNNHRVLVFQGQ